MFRVGQTSSALAKIFASRCVVSTIKPNYFHTSDLFFAKLNATKVALPIGYRPPTPYSLFLKEVYQPGMPIGEAGKQTGEKWKTLTADQVAQYKEEAAKIGVERSEQFGKLSQTEKDKIYQQQVEARQKRQLRAQRSALHKYYEETNRPTQPPNGYALYMKEKMSNKTGNHEQVNTAFREAAKKWKTLSEKEKESYNNEAQKLRDEYGKQLEQWKTKDNLEAKKKFVVTKPGRPKSRRPGRPSISASAGGHKSRVRKTKRSSTAFKLP